MSSAARRAQAHPRTADEKRALLARRLRERARADRTAAGPCLHHRFEAHAARTPGAVALTFEGRGVTYAELNDRADLMADRLRGLGVGPGVLVGMFVERSVEMVVGLLGVLKAGGAYLPMDPVYPRDRLGWMLADSAAPVLLTQSGLLDRLPEHAAHVVCLDDDADGGSWRAGGVSPLLVPSEGAAGSNQQGAHAPRSPGTAGSGLDPAVTPDDLAYVIYTSGSTGKPKGVPVTHANVGRLLDATDPWFRFGPDDVWTLFHSFAFDFSVWEIWGALAFGGRLVVVPYLVSRSPEAFHALLAAERVTVLNQTPSAFRQLIRADEAAGTKPGDLALRYVIFGGEALELQGLKPWFDRHGDRRPRLVNMYGITETTVHVTYRPVTAADLAAHPGSSPIGRPIPDLKLYVLDKHLQPVPIGVPGEIHVGGAGVARGYLNRPALTAERFIPDPFSGRPGARLYRSGDLARYRPDGELEYLGRADDQVKIRGHRVELGEIEAALGRDPAVREAAVLVRQDTPGDPRLVAYVVGVNGQAPPVGDLRDRLKEELPPYMLPSAIVALEALPLTANGKVDRRALPAPEGDRPSSGSTYVAPRTPTEAAVAATWAEVLALGRVGIHDDFFDLGGHSLLALQVVARLRDAFAEGAGITLRELFEAPTVAGLAALVDAARAGARSRRAPAIRPIPRDGALPTSFAQRSLWFLDQLDPGRPTFNVAVAVRVAGPLDVDALGHALRAMVRRHESLRTTFAAPDGDPVQVIAEEQPGSRINEPRTETARVPLAACPPVLAGPIEDTGGQAASGTQIAGTSEMAPAFSFEMIDLSGLPAVGRAAESRRLATEEARRPFDLAAGPLVRAGLLKLAADEHILMMTMHHIVTDGWSLGVAAEELAALYDASRRGEPSPLPAPAIHYADYAAWQREWLRGEALEELLGYWTARLAGVPALELPADRPRPAARSSRGSTRFFALPVDLSARLHALGRREGTTPFMTLLAAFQALLGRYSGQDDFAVGSPVANRNRPEVEGLIGYFVNMIALRADLAGDPTFRELLARTRESALGAFEHQDVPLELVVEALDLPRDPSRTPLFQVMFVLQNNRFPDVSRQDLALTPFDAGAGSGTAKFDLTLALVDADGVLAGSFEYSTDLFEDATIERLVGHFLNLLESAAADPDHRLSELPLLGDAERHRLIHELNPPPTPFPRDSCVHELIAEQADRTPEATALAWEGGSLTYRELDARANQLAHHLRRRGVGADVRVGICVERSPEMAVGLLGILKAGGAYVPLDPSYPAERLAFMIEDAKLALLLTQEHLRHRLPPSATRRPDHPVGPTSVGPIPEAAPGGLQSSSSRRRPPTPTLPHAARGEGVKLPPPPAQRGGGLGWGVVEDAPDVAIGPGWSIPVLCLDADRALIAREPSAAPPRAATPESAAYVIYTSGSTGTPRGVIVPHRGLVNHNTAAAKLFDLTPADRVLQFSSLSFDIAVEELFPAWIAGAAVVLRGGDETLEPAEFSRRISRDRITVLDLPTAYWHAWVDGLTALGETLPASLRLVIVGGEKAQSAAYARWKALATDRVRWLNTYGPTEATVIATAFEPPADWGRGRDDLPIGRPIANTQVYLLDRHLRPVPLGLPGELFIGGEGVARGYLDRSALTAERFPPDPFAATPGARLFRTGDLARWRPDGTLEFLGRTDHQVKIRGFRVEPGEVEAALLQHPAVREAVVLARVDGAGVGRLDAYVVMDENAGASPATLRSFLVDRLPRHMVPATISPLPALPLTVSGKVDRRALPEPNQVPRAAAVPPRDDLEAGLVAIWEDVLDARPIGIADNFFDLGGHSLLAIRLLARVEAKYGRRLPLSALFFGATIEDLAVLLRQPSTAEAWTPLVPIQPEGSGTPFFCVHPAGGIVYCFRDLARLMGTDRPFYGLEAAGLDGERAPVGRLEEMAARYVEAIRAAQPAGPYHLGGWSLGGLIAFEMARQLREQRHEVATVALFDTQAPAADRRVDPETLALARQLRELGEGVEALGLLESDEDAVALAEVARELALGFGGDVRKLFDHMRRLPAEEQREAILRYFGIDRVYHLEAGPERVARLWDVLRANFLAGARYSPGPYDGRVTLYRAGARRLDRRADPTMGWARLATGGVTAHAIPGDHATILKSPGVEAIAATLRAELRAGEGHP